MNVASRNRILLALTGLALAAVMSCDRAPSMPQGPGWVQALQPVEAASGLPSAGPASLVEQIARWEFGVDEDRVELVGLRRVSNETSTYTVEVDPDGPRVPGEPPCVVLRDLGWNAADIDRLALSARVENGGEIRVHFGEGAPPTPVARFGQPKNATAFDLFPDAKSGGPLELRAARVDLRPAWGGSIDWIAIEVRIRVGQVELESLTATRSAMGLGASPRFANELLLDAGLVQLPGRRGPSGEVRLESERAIPLRAGGVQTVEVELEGPATLFTSIAPLRAARKTAIRFEIRVAGSRTPLLKATIEPDDAFRGWRPLRVELPNSADSLTLEFEAFSDRADGFCALLGSPQVHHRGTDRRPSLLLVTADTLRADHVDCLRNAAGLPGLPGLATPNLDALAERGSLFTDVLSASNATLPSHASLFTGRTPRDHGVIDNRHKLGEANHTLSEHLGSSGWHTVHASAVGHLNPKDSGLGQGVQRYLETPSASAFAMPFGTPPVLDALPPEQRDELRHQGVEFGVPRAIDELERAGERPLFFWVHLFDPHTPNLPRQATLDRFGLRDAPAERLWLAELAGASATTDGADAASKLVERYPHLSFATDVRQEAFARALYAASVSQLDEGLGELFRAFEQRAGERDLVAFTSDHGEGLGERGVWFAHSGLYQNTLHVPLILAGGDVPAGRIVEAPVSTLDLAVSLAELLGAPTFENTSGVSFLPALFEPVSPAPPEPRRRWFQHARDRQVGYREGSRHVVWTRESFRLGVAGRAYSAGTLERLEPAALPSGTEADREIDPADPESSELGSALEAWLSDRSQSISAQSAVLGADAEAALRALGYTD